MLDAFEHLQTAVQTALTGRRNIGADPVSADDQAFQFKFIKRFAQCGTGNSKLFCKLPLNKGNMPMGCYNFSIIATFITISTIFRIKDRKTGIIVTDPEK